MLTCTTNIGMVNTKIHHLHQEGSRCYGSVLMEQEPTTRKSITMPVAVWQAIDMFRFREHFGSEAEAVRRIVLAGLKSLNVVVAQREGSE